MGRFSHQSMSVALRTEKCKFICFFAHLFVPLQNNYGLGSL